MAFRISEGNGLEQVVELAAGYGIGNSVSVALDPLLRALANAAWTTAPNMPVDVVSLARLRMMESLDAEGALEEAANNGFNPTRFARYINSLRQVPGADVLFELARRGELDPAELELWLERAGVDLRLAGAVATLVRTHLSPAEAALARQQGFIGAGEQRAVAALYGIDAGDAQLQFEIVGLPPGIGEGLTLLRRKVIDEERFAQYVREGHTKTKYTDDLLALKYEPLSAAVAAELLIRERIPEAEALDIAEKNGIRADDFLTWSRGLGRPIAPGEALTIINRGLKGNRDGAEAHAYFHEVVARSDVRTQYADDLFELRIKYPPLFQVMRALDNGTATPELARETLLKEGYTAEWVSAIVDAHSKGHKAKTRDLAAAIVDTLYEAGLYSHPEAAKALETLGYDADEAAKYLDLWLARRIVSELVRGVGVIRSRYISWKIDRPTALRLLDELLSDPEASRRLMPLWDDEREANAPVLTAGEIDQGFKYGRFGFDEAMQRLQLLGYTLEDARTKLWIVAHGDPSTVPAPASP